MSIFDKIKTGLLKTKESMMSKFQGVINSFTKIDEDLFDELEETMIMSDMGVQTSTEICNQLRKKIKERGITDPKEIMALLEEVITDMIGEDRLLDISTKPSIIMVIGVNGAGKTTTIGKLCKQLKDDGKKVLVAAADTFRAAAIEQLEVWTERAGVDIVKHSEGSDPASVVFDAIDAAKARGCDVLICDTAGRLHNKKNLMTELEKIGRIIKDKAPDSAKEILLVLDATTGQNAVNQARLFKEVADITGIVLTKLDGTAKGGIVISIKNELGIPVKLIGVGEKIDDLQPFNSKMFVKALFGGTYDDEEEIKFIEQKSDDEIAEEETAVSEETIEETDEQPKKKGGFFGIFGKKKEDPKTIEQEEETVVEEPEIIEPEEETVVEEPEIIEPEEETVVEEPEEETVIEEAEVIKPEEPEIIEQEEEIIVEEPEKVEEEIIEDSGMVEDVIEAPKKRFEVNIPEEPPKFEVNIPDEAYDLDDIITTYDDEEDLEEDEDEEQEDTKKKGGFFGLFRKKDKDEDSQEEKPKKKGFFGFGKK